MEIRDSEKSLVFFILYICKMKKNMRKESRIFYFIHLQNEEEYEREESSSAR